MPQSKQPSGGHHWSETNSVCTPRSPWSEAPTTAKSPSCPESSPAGSVKDWIDSVQTTPSIAAYRFNMEAVDAASDTDSDDDSEDPEASLAGGGILTSFASVFGGMPLKGPPPPMQQSPPPVAFDHVEQKFCEIDDAEKVMRVIRLDECIKLPDSPSPLESDLPSFPLLPGLVQAAPPPGLEHPASAQGAAQRAAGLSPPSFALGATLTAACMNLPSTLKLTKGERCKLVPPQRQYEGTVKMINEVHGYSFVACPEVRAIYGRDVYLSKALVPVGVRVGDRLVFMMGLSSKGRPMATKVSIVV